MEKWEIRPPLPQKPLNRLSPKSTWVIKSWNPTPTQNFITMWLPPFAPQICENAHQGLVFLFFCQPTTKTPVPIFTVNASNDVVSRKDVHFGGLENKILYFDPIFPQNGNLYRNSSLQADSLLLIKAAWRSLCWRPFYVAAVLFLRHSYSRAVRLISQTAEWHPVKRIYMGLEFSPDWPAMVIFIRTQLHAGRWRDWYANIDEQRAGSVQLAGDVLKVRSEATDASRSVRSHRTWDVSSTIPRASVSTTPTTNCSSAAIGLPISDVAHASTLLLPLTEKLFTTHRE